VLCAGIFDIPFPIDVQELLIERGLEVVHTTIWRWVQRYAPELNERTRPHPKPTNKSWRVDETYVRIKGRWFYLYCAIDSAGATIDFFLSAFRSAHEAKAFFARALADPSHPQPRVINTDQAKSYPPTIRESKEEGVLRRRCRHRPVQYLNNMVEQDHRAIKKRIRAKQHFRQFGCARRTIQGFETMHKILKGQVRRVTRVTSECRTGPSIRCSASLPELALSPPEPIPLSFFIFARHPLQLSMPVRGKHVYIPVRENDEHVRGVQSDKSQTFLAIRQFLPIVA
jgi:IS6 family transposase